MAHRDLHSGARLAALELLCLAGLLAGVAGCGARDPLRAAARVAESISGGLDADVLRIATTWPRSEQKQLEREFRDQTSRPVPVRLVWVELSPGTRLDNLDTRALPVDVLLGGPLTEYIRLSRAGRLEPLDGQGAPDWFVARRQQIALSDGFSRGREQVACDDPRVDPPTMTWAAGQLRDGSWRDGYARLVLLFSHAFNRPGWQSGSAAAAANRGEAAQTLRVAALSGSPGEGDLDPSVVSWNEGAAILRGSWHRSQARAFLRFLADHHGATPGRESPELDPEVSDLLADLLGATLVDAQEELLAAASAVARADDPASAQAQAWLTERPPWPPASVEKLQSRGGESALAMVQDLAGQIAPDPEPRFWLVQSWLRPARPIDQAMLTELARAAGGRLVREPRFRAWLRGEWTAWARQRYRRVARLVAAAGSATGATPQRSPRPRNRF
ncbi:MAG TPA: hypothetical protein VKF17_01775 [Isosphaeraceae bacterium]|nr:hypothetical protein [Isosphaeraceae bacterium]